MKPTLIETILMCILFAVLLIAPSCTTWKSTTDLTVQSQSERLGNQTIDLHRTLDATKDN